MEYHVTFRLGHEEFTEQMDAPDAATAVSKVQFERGRGDEPFELISVQLMETEEDADAVEVVH